MASTRPHTLAKVLYNYSATSSTELTITKGQTIRVYEKFKKGWWTGEDENGKVGLFPGSYVRELKDRSSTVLSPASASASAALTAAGAKQRPLSEMPAQASPAGDVQYCRAKEDHTAKHSKQLSFKAGDVITLQEKYVTGWWKGELNGAVGMFPSTAIEFVSAKEAQQGQADASSGEVVVRSESGSKRRRKPIGRAEVLYDYQGATATELTVRKGDVVNVLKKIPDSGWWQGELDGKVGHFPCKYVKELEEAAVPPAEDSSVAAVAASPEVDVTPQSSASSAPAKSERSEKEQARVLYDFQAVEATELPLRKGNVVTILERGDAGGWWKGELDGVVGHFPGQYVRLLVDESQGGSGDASEETIAASQDGDSTPSKQTKEKKKKAKKATESPIKRGEEDLKKSKGKAKAKVKSKKDKGSKAKSKTDEASRKAAEAMSRADELSKKAAAAQKKAELAKRKADLHSTYAVGKYDYEAQGPTELSFKAGDSIRVVEVLASGWWKGELRGKVGHFPGSYVREAKNQAKRVRALYAYQGQTKTELSFEKGDILIKLHDVGDGWCKGEFEGRRGHFPSNYAKEIEDDDKEGTAAAAAAAAAADATDATAVPEPVRAVDEAAPESEAPAPQLATAAHQRSVPENEAGAQPEPESEPESEPEFKPEPELVPELDSKSHDAPSTREDACEPDQEIKQEDGQEENAEDGGGLCWPEEEGEEEEIPVGNESEQVNLTEPASTRSVSPGSEPPSQPEHLQRPQSQRQQQQQETGSPVPPPVASRRGRGLSSAALPTSAAGSPPPGTSHAAMDSQVLASILAKQEHLERLVSSQASDISQLREELKQCTSRPKPEAAHKHPVEAKQNRQSLGGDGLSALDDPNIEPTLASLRKQLKAETRNRRELELITRKLESDVEVLSRTLERVQREMAEQFTLEQIGQQRLKRTGRDLTS